LGSESGEILQLDRPKTSIMIDSNQSSDIELLKQGKIDEVFPIPENCSDLDRKAAEEFVGEQKKNFGQIQN